MKAGVQEEPGGQDGHSRQGKQALLHQGKLHHLQACIICGNAGSWIPGTFTRFTRFLHDFTRFLRFLRYFLPGKKFSIPGTKNYYPGLGVTPNQRSLAKDHSFSGFCWHPSLIHCCSTPCDQDDKMPSDGRSWMEEGSDSAGICTVGINLIFQSHFHSWTCPWRNPVAWL